MTMEQPPVVGVLCALPEEFAAVGAVFGATPIRSPTTGDTLQYQGAQLESRLGGTVSVVIGLMPQANNNHAAVTATSMLLAFPSVKDVLMLGIAAGIPYPKDPEKHVRLGDIVVSNEYGITQFDVGKLEDGTFSIRDTSPKPSARLLGAAKALEADARRGDRSWEKYFTLGHAIEGGVRPAARTDRLSQGKHPSDPRRRGMPLIHLGCIATSNLLVRDSKARDELRVKYNCVAVEMEAGGLADAAWQHSAGFLIVRGICDYADHLKNDLWHGYAALAAACYGRALLQAIPGEMGPPNTESENVPPDGPGPALDPLVDYYSRSFVGRAEALDLIRRCGSSPFGQKHVVIVGEPGIGKSALAAMAARRGRDDPTWPYVVSCFVKEGLDQNTVVRVLGVAVDALARIKGQRITVSDTSEGVRNQFARLWSEVCDDPPTRGVVLIIDGLDEQASELVPISESLPTGSGPKAGLIVMTRPNPAHLKSLDRAHPLHRAPPVHLESLSMADVAELVAKETLEPIADVAVDRIYSVTGGNPLFIRLMLDELTTSGSLIMHFEDRGTGQLASYFQGIVENRLEALPPTASAILVALAVAKGPLSHSDLVDILASDRVTIRSSLRAFERHLVGDDRYTFSHPELARIICEMFGASAVERATTSIEAWMEGYRQRDWPTDTPRYIVDTYSRHLQVRSPEMLSALISAEWADAHRRTRKSLSGFVEDVEVALRDAASRGAVPDVARLSLIFLMAGEDVAQLPPSAVATVVLLSGLDALPYTERPDGLPFKDALLDGYAAAATAAARLGRVGDAQTLAREVVHLQRVGDRSSDEFYGLGAESPLVTALVALADGGGQVSEAALRMAVEIDSESLSSLTALGAALARNQSWVAFEALAGIASQDYDLFVSAHVGAAVAASLAGDHGMAREVRDRIPGANEALFGREFLNQAVEAVAAGNHSRVLESLTHWTLPKQDPGHLELIEDLVRVLAAGGDSVQALGLVESMAPARERGRLRAAVRSLARRGAGRGTAAPGPAPAPKGDHTRQSYVQWWADWALECARVGSFVDAERAIRRVTERSDPVLWSALTYRTILTACSELEEDAGDLTRYVVRTAQSAIEARWSTVGGDLSVELLHSLVVALDAAMRSEVADRVLRDVIAHARSLDDDMVDLSLGELAFAFAAAGDAGRAEAVLRECIAAGRSGVDEDTYLQWLVEQVRVIAGIDTYTLPIEELLAVWVNRSESFASILGVCAALTVGGRSERYARFSPHRIGGGAYGIVAGQAHRCASCCGALSSLNTITGHEPMSTEPDSDWFEDERMDAGNEDLFMLASELLGSGDWCSGRNVLAYISPYLHDAVLEASVLVAGRRDDFEDCRTLLTHISAPEVEVRAISRWLWEVSQSADPRIHEFAVMAEASLKQVRPRSMQSAAVLRCASVSALFGDTERYRRLVLVANEVADVRSALRADPGAVGLAFGSAPDAPAHVKDYLALGVTGTSGALSAEWARSTKPYVHSFVRTHGVETFFEKAPERLARYATAVESEPSRSVLLAPADVLGFILGGGSRQVGANGWYRRLAAVAPHLVACGQEGVARSALLVDMEVEGIWGDSTALIA